MLRPATSIAGILSARGAYIPFMAWPQRGLVWVLGVPITTALLLLAAETTATDRPRAENRGRSAVEARDIASAPSSGVETPFAGRTSVRYEELVSELRAVADALTTNPNVVNAHAALLEKHRLSVDEVPLSSFSRVRLVFEATRDGGLWGLRWGITDQMPWSDQVWKQWVARAALLETTRASSEDYEASAIAECDELSALFALLARDLGTVGFVALHWPVWNHVVAVWQVPRQGGGHARIVVPTSQVFLSRDATLGTTELATRRVLFAYSRRDLRDESEIPGSLARFLVGRARALGGLSSAELSARRNRRGGS